MDSNERASRLAARSLPELKGKLREVRNSLLNAQASLKAGLKDPDRPESREAIVWARARIQELNRKAAILSQEIERRDNATADVIRELSKDYPGTGNRGAVYEHLDLSSLELFTVDAKRWIGDRSELSLDTLESADYAEALGYAREMTDWKERK